MATTTIPWGDGSGDNIYLTYTSASGNQTVEVTSDANDGPARTKDITFVSTVGNIARVLTVIQETNMSYVSITWNDTCITYNDTAIAYPYEEPYIVFVDSEVEAICVSNWGDGTGLKPSQAAQVTSSQFGTKFSGNTDIISFDELQYFTGLTELPSNAFYNSSNLETVKLPTTITKLGANAFRGTALTEIELPAGIELAGGQAFYNCSALAVLTIRGSVIFSSNYPFYNCTLLKRVNIPDVATWFSLSISGSNRTIGGYSRDVHLYLNSNPTTELTEITIPDTVTTLSAYIAYYFKGLTSVTIPATMTGIGNSAFQACSNLAEVVVLATSPPTLGTNVFSSTASSLKIYVPYGTGNTYKAATSWSGYASKIYELNQDGTIPT